MRQAWARSVAEPAIQLGAVVVIVGVVAVAFLPVWRDGYLSERIERAEDLPAYWHDVARALDRDDDGTRVLELPGSLFAAYRWGNTVDPITPGLIDRPWVARELLPFGTRGSVDLLAALDRRMQQGTFEAAALAPVARLLAAGTIVDRNDLAYERYDSPRPRQVWRWLTDPRPAGLGQPVGFGGRAPNRASPERPMLDEVELRSSGTAWPPQVALFPVTSARRIVSTASTDQPLVLAGDGEGVVDAAAAGLVDGDGVLLYSATLDRPALRRALAAEARLLVTDTARKRARRWDTLKDDTGLTERAGQRAVAEDPLDYRYEIVPDLRDGDRTVAETRGGTADATTYGPGDGYVPSERPARAFDGDVRTAWRVAEGRDLDGDRLALRLDAPVRSDGITVVQPAGALRPITGLRVRLDGGTPFDVTLDERSRVAPGQRIAFPRQRVRTVELEPTAVGDGPRSAVGLAEVRLDGVATRRPVLDEVLRVPTRLLRRAGPAAATRPIGFVFTRARREPADRNRVDEELSLARRFVLPATAVGEGRTFGVSGTARVDANAPDATLDTVLGTTVPGVEYRASAHRAGDASARASRAFDGDPSTAWGAPFGIQEGQWIETDLGVPTTVQGATIRVVADGRHSVPTRCGWRPTADRSRPSTCRRSRTSGRRTRPRRSRSRSAPSRRSACGSSSTRRGRCRPPTIARAIRLRCPSASPRSVSPVCRERRSWVPTIPRVVTTCCASTARPSPCVSRLAEEQLESCAGPLPLDAGSHVLRSGTGLDTGIDVDRAVLTSGSDGAAVTAQAFGPRRSPSGARVAVRDHGATTYDLRVRSDGAPFWLVLGQSHSDGWKAELTGPGGATRSLGAPRLVNGYANGWLVDPGRAGTFTVQLRWTGQNIMWLGYLVSLLVIAGCLVVLVVTRRRPVPDVSGAPELGTPFGYDADAVPWRAAVVTAAAAGVGAWLVSRPWIGLVVAAGTLLAARVRGARILLAAGAPLALVLGRAADAPELGWLAVLLLAADLLTCCVAHLEIRRRATQVTKQAQR